MKSQKLFEESLISIKNLLEDYEFAQEVYAALCNRTWQSLDDPELTYDCTWRYAAGLIARIRSEPPSGRFADHRVFLDKRL